MINYKIKITENPYIKDHIEVSIEEAVIYDKYDKKRKVYQTKADSLKQALVDIEHFLHLDQFEESSDNEDIQAALDDCKKTVAIGSGVYFLKPIGHEVVKIGISKSVPTRTKQLEESMPYQLENLLTLQPPSYYCLRDLESCLHQHFASERIKGEWFKLEKPILEFIRNKSNEK